MTKSEKNLIDAVLASVTNGVFYDCENFEELVKLANSHLVQNLVAEVLPTASNVPSSVVADLSEKQTLLVIKDANQESEVLHLMKLFEENEIPVVMLKGWVMKKLYPRSDMRSMADTDIFIRQSDEQKVHDIIKSQGYSVVAFGGKKDNVYNKKPFVILEVHKNLFMFEDSWNEFFNSADSRMCIWNRIEKISGYDYVYKMDNELFFVYMIAHIAKHLLDDGGIGVKAILDVWMFMKETPELDLQIAFRDLEKLQLKDFANSVIELTRFWFDKKENVSKTTEEFGDYIFKCGVYGNSKILVATKEGIMNSDNPSQLKYVLRRAFPTVDEMKVRFPQLNKRIWLLPFLYTKRLWYSLRYRTALVKKEIRSAGEVDYSEVKRIQRLYNDIGLK